MCSTLDHAVSDNVRKSSSHNTIATVIPFANEPTEVQHQLMCWHQIKLATHFRGHTSMGDKVGKPCGVVAEEALST